MANAIAEFIEAQQQEAFKLLATREDVLISKQEVLKEISKNREEAAKSEANLIKEIAGKYNLLVAVLTALGVALTLINKFL